LRLLAAFVLVIATATATLDFTTRRAWESSLRQEIVRNLRQKTVMFANRVNTDRERNLQDIVSQEGQAAGARATVIDVTGKVLADSEAAPAAIDNLAYYPEFAVALKGELGTDTLAGQNLGIPFLYVAAPISGGAARLAYPLSDLEAALQLRNTLLISSALAFLVALLLAGVLSGFTARRLQRIVEFANKIDSGELTARIAEGSGDEIGQVAAALDKTARHVENNFAALRDSQRQLETLLNSMEDAVIAVGSDERVQWANQRMDSLVPQRTRLNAPIVKTVRDPYFLRAVEKTRRYFIVNVAHELRMPLTSIQGYAETLLDSSPENNHSREFLEIIRKNAHRMSRLTEDLLTLARVESGEQRFDIQPVAAADILQEAVQNFRELARAHGIDLQVEDSAQDLVSADREAIHQVFSNLIDNALKYAASGGQLVLGARRSNDAVEFYVRDFGPGIPFEHLPRLFERFYRVDKARSREAGGTGLCLTIAKHIVLAHDGTIRAESELNHGSVFLFTLPLATDSAPASLGGPV
jgi:two-component system phosphate regulon sensor histidine kinase PhoR